MTTSPLRRDPPGSRMASVATFLTVCVCAGCGEAAAPAYPTRFTVAPVRLDLTAGQTDTLVVTAYNASDQVMHPGSNGTWAVSADAVVSKSCTDCPFTLQPADASQESSQAFAVATLRAAVDTIRVRVVKPGGCLDPPGCTQHYLIDILAPADVPITISP